MTVMTFNGTTRNYIKVQKIRRPSWASLTRNILTIPGMPGGLLDNTDISPRLLTVSFKVEGINQRNLQRTKEDLANWLITDSPKELIFDDEPDRIYYAIVDGTFDPDEILGYGRGDITFICPDPFKYAVNESSKSFGSSGSVNVTGNVAVDPIVSVTVSSDITFLSIGDGKNINMIGSPAEVEQTPLAKEQTIYLSSMNTVSGWLDSTSVEESVVSGTLVSNGTYFYPSSYGTGAAWHGPAKKVPLSESLADFKVEAYVKQIGNPGQAGVIEIALLDGSNAFMGKMKLSKKSVSSQSNWFRARAGSYANGRDIVNTVGYSEKHLSVFDGVIRLTRIGQVWTAYIAQLDFAGKHVGAMTTQWRDTNNIAPQLLSQVQVQIMQYGTATTTQQYVDNLRVNKINAHGPTQKPVIAKSGDIVEFDHVSNIIRVNGENASSNKAFIGEYFKLNPGVTSLTVEPSSSVSSTVVRWKNKWR